MDRKALILAIETATGCGSVALTLGGVKQGYLLAEMTNQPRITHARRLLGSVEWIMQNSGAKWQEIDAVAVSLGPGSFTGLRIGLAAAKGIAMAAGLPLVGVPTLDALALQVAPTTKPLCCVLDARKKELYAGWYRYTNGSVQVIQSAYAVAPDALLDGLQEPVIMSGPGIASYAELFASHPLVELVSTVQNTPRAASIGFLGAALFERGELPEPAEIVPLYVRASEAEINLQRQKSK